MQAWLQKHPRFHIHPTSASWLNMVERFFRSISTNRLERGVFKSVPELITAIEESIAVHNKNPKPLIWTAKANDILRKVIRAKRYISSKKSEVLHYEVESLNDDTLATLFNPITFLYQNHSFTGPCLLKSCKLFTLGIAGVN